MRRDELIGAWKLESYVQEDVETGEIEHPMGENPQGLILYTRDGYMSAQVGRGGRPHFVDSDPYGGTAEEYAAAGATYIAYSGPFHFDEERQLLEHDMFVSFFPNWQGQRQLRVAAFDRGSAAPRD